MIVTDPTKVDGWLREGIAISEVMRRSSWGRAQITARAASLGLVISPNTDKARAKIHDEPDTDDEEKPASLKDAARSIMEQRRNGVEQPGPRPAAPAVDPYAELLNRCVQGNDRNLQRRAQKVLQGLQELRAAEDKIAAKEKLRREIATHEAEIARLRGELAGSRTGREQSRDVRSAAAGQRQRDWLRSVGATFTEVRDWANGNGFEVASRGWVPVEVRVAYEAAHKTEVA